MTYDQAVCKGQALLGVLADNSGTASTFKYSDIFAKGYKDSTSKTRDLDNSYDSLFSQKKWNKASFTKWAVQNPDLKSNDYGNIVEYTLFMSIEAKAIIVELARSPLGAPAPDTPARYVFSSLPQN